MNNKEDIIERYEELSLKDEEAECIKLLKEYPFLLEAPMDNEKNTPFLLACEQEHHKVMDYLIEKGVNIHLSNTFEQNAIFFGIHKESIELMEKLYSLGLELDQKDFTGSTPLLEACSFNYSTMIKFLIEKGADVNVERKEESFVSLLKEQIFELEFSFILKHFDKFNEKNQKILKGLQLKNLVTKGVTDDHE